MTSKAYRRRKRRASRRQERAYKRRDHLVRSGHRLLDDLRDSSDPARQRLAIEDIAVLGRDGLSLIHPAFAQWAADALRDQIKRLDAPLRPIAEAALSPLGQVATRNSVTPRWLAPPWEVITRWDGREVRGARSRKSHVFAAFDWRELTLRPGTAIEQKARKDRRSALAFREEDRAPLKMRAGAYSKAQSINSEDTVTWSVFGAHDPNPWIPGLLDHVFGAAERPTGWKVEFWKRAAHPDTGKVHHGPESDVTLTAVGGWCYVVEAKWLQDLDAAQGVGGKTSQLQMRAHTARILGCAGCWGALVIAPGPNLYPYAKRSGSVFGRYFEPADDGYRPTAVADELGARAVTWEQVAELLPSTTTGKEVRAYLKWRLATIR